jgi:U3 small nucleolar RNA-associated protein 14
LTTPPPPPRPKIMALGLEHLDPLDVVEVAEILNVVAHPVDEEVGGGVVAAQRDLVAVAFAGPGRRAGDEGQKLGD